MRKATLANLLFHWTGAERVGYSGEMSVLKELRRRGVWARRVDGMGYDLIAGAAVAIDSLERWDAATGRYGREVGKR